MPMRDDREIKKGGINDPVARSIRAEQNRDAAPSPDEMEDLIRKAEVEHAEFVAARAFLDHYDAPTDPFTMAVAADVLGFDALEQTALSADGRAPVRRWKDVRLSHVEPHEVSVDNPQYPARPFQMTEQARELKAEKFTQVQGALDVVTDVRAGRKILNPFGAGEVRVVAIESDDRRARLTIRTNDLFGRAMRDDSWSDKFGAGTIDEYQRELGDLLVRVAFPD